MLNDSGKCSHHTTQLERRRTRLQIVSSCSECFLFSHASCQRMIILHCTLYPIVRVHLCRSKLRLSYACRVCPHIVQHAFQDISENSTLFERHTVEMNFGRYSIFGDEIIYVSIRHISLFSLIKLRIKCYLQQTRLDSIKLN